MGTEGQLIGNRVKRRMTEVDHLPYDIVFQIFLLLPAKDLHVSKFVCKAWYSLISSSAFVEAHTSRCETVIAFLKSLERPNTFPIESRPSELSIFEPLSRPRLYIHFLEFQNGKGKITDPNISGFGNILASCNGLILTTTTPRDNGLLVVNPMTRNRVALRQGTTAAPGEGSYGFVLSPSTGEYKVVHLFRDKSRHFDCEILSLRTKSWWAVAEPPPLGSITNFERPAVAVSGFLYWLPSRNSASYLVSMDVDGEKFDRKDLPITSTEFDRLFEIKEVLCFVSHVTVYRIQLWSLKMSKSAVEWVKHHTVNMDYDISCFVPVLATRNGTKLFFMRNDGSLCAYDFEDEEMEAIEVHGNFSLKSRYGMGLPHVNTLSSWQIY